jgi:hypothetical protein
VPVSLRDPLLTAERILNAVIHRAARAGAPNLDRIARLAGRCLLNGRGHARGLAHEAHCEHVRAALFHCEQGQWFLAAEELDH